MLKIAAQSAEVLSTSPLSPSKLVSEHFVKAPVGGKAGNPGVGSRHFRKTHSGKLGRAKKGNCLYYVVLLIVWNLGMCCDLDSLSNDIIAFELYIIGICRLIYT